MFPVNDNNLVSICYIPNLFDQQKNKLGDYKLDGVLMQMRKSQQTLQPAIAHPRHLSGSTSQANIVIFKSVPKSIF